MTPDFVSLRDHFERRMDDLDRRISERFVLSDSAVSKAERTMNERLNSMNEFREALKDQSSKMATRNELEKVEEAVNELRRAKANLDGRLVIVSGAISLVVTLALWALGKMVP